MSKKTFKRIALGVVASLVVTPLVALTPATAADGPTILTASSVSGTIAATANGTTATGTVTLNLVEPSSLDGGGNEIGDGWNDTAGDLEITLRLNTRFGAGDQCWFEANTDGTAKGAIVSGYSDELFASVNNEPLVEADTTAKTLTVTIFEDTSDQTERESITVSGLTVRCSTGAAVGRIYVEVLSAGLVAGANVNATLSTAEVLPEVLPHGFRIDISNSATTSNWPMQAASSLGRAYIASTAVSINAGTDVGTEVATASATASGTITTGTDHGLNSGDRVIVNGLPAASVASTPVTNFAAGALNNTALFVEVTGLDTFKLWQSKNAAINGTTGGAGARQVEFGVGTANAISVFPAVVDVNAGTLEGVTADNTNEVFTAAAAHSLSTGNALVFTTGNAGTGDGLTANTTYFVELISATTFYLHTTRTGALAGTAGTIVNVTTNYQDADFNKTIVLPAVQASGATMTFYGPDALVWAGSTSDVYLGAVGSVGASFNTSVNATLLVTSVATKPVIGAGDPAGVLTVATNSAGALADTTATTFTVTLTGGKFQIAPTITGTGTCSLTANLVYPRDSVTVVSPAGNCSGFTVAGTYDISGLTAGGSLSANVTVDNATDPVSYTSSTQTRNLITFAAATGAPTTPATLASGDSDAAGAVVTVTESSAGAFKTGHWLSICFADGGDLFNTDSKFVWATVTDGDLKLAGNVTTLRATITDDTSGIGAWSNNVGDQQCAQVRVFSASTTASKIVFSAGTPTEAESAVPFRMDTGAANGVVRMAVIAGSSTTGGQLYSSFNVGNRSATNNFTVGAAAAASFQIPASSAALPSVTIAEKAKDMFGTTIVLRLTDSQGVASSVSRFVATSGADAPVVTQTSATSDIAWTYAVAATTVTITVTSGSTNTPGTFVVSNLKVNVSDVNLQTGLAVTDNNLFVTVNGNGVGGNSYYLKMASIAPADVVLEPVAPELSITKNNGRIFLTGICMDGEGDVIVYVKSPGKAWQELAKTAECFAGAFDSDRVAPKNPKLYRVKQEGTGLFSNQVLIRP